ncbi:hypothetical protein UJ101_02605 [Flavobacteriaceae bacterium UJ101]|nr:hypothetical protein UJ101_02605 [Flavobacteriaceae bacterium UJ101]
MIQRIQSIYLFIVSLLTGTTFGFFNDEWINEEYFGILGMIIGSCILAIIVIFLFRKRGFQIKLNRLNVLLNLSIIGLLTYRLLNIPGGINFPEKGIELIIPIVIAVLAIVFLFLANKAIKKDDELVKSVDRIR